MKTTAPKKIFVILLLMLQSSGLILAQQRTSLGFNLTTNFDYYTNIKPETGFVFERQVTKHSGMEMGINYRTYQRELFLLLNNEVYYPLISEKYISIPISYKFYSKIVNVGLGLTFDYNIGWKYSNTTIDIITYRPDYDYYAGLIVKISKEILLGDDLILEPELKTNALIIPSERFYTGMGIVLKFDLTKD